MKQKLRPSVCVPNGKAIGVACQHVQGVVRFDLILCSVIFQVMQIVSKYNRATLRGIFEHYII